VEVAITGAAGLEHVSDDPPDIILLDLRLPDASGLEIFERIRALDARIPVIFVHHAKTADAAIEAMKKGAFDYLFKPLDINQLRRVAGEALEVARLMRAPRDHHGDSTGNRDGWRNFRYMRGHARGLQSYWQSSGPGRNGADRGRERHR